MNFAFRVESAKNKQDQGEEAPVHVPMAPRSAERRNPSTDQKKVRRQLTKKASGGDPNMWYVFGPPDDSPVSPAFSTSSEAKAYLAASSLDRDEFYVGSGFGAWQSYSDSLADAMSSQASQTDLRSAVTRHAAEVARRVANMGEEDDEVAPHDGFAVCPACGGAGNLLGQLGQRWWYRCRDCGDTFDGGGMTTASRTSQRRTR